MRSPTHPCRLSRSTAASPVISMALHDLSVDAKHEFMAGYGLSESEVRDIAPVLKAINIMNYAPFVERAAAEGDKPKLEQYRTRLSGALDLYSL